MSTRDDFDIKADVEDCGNPRDGKTSARPATINTNKSLRMVRPSLKPSNHLGLSQDSSLR